MQLAPSPLKVTVLTALAVETSAMLAQLDSSTLALDGPFVTHVGQLRGSPGPCVVTVIQIGAGNTNAAMQAGRASKGGTDVLLFVGIAGSLKDLALGDVVAATSVAWLHRGKREGGEWLYRPDADKCSPVLTSLAGACLQNQDEWRKRLERLADSVPMAYVGQILSGEELVKDKGYKSGLKRQFSDALAVENEGFGTVSAVSAALQTLVIRGASDDADDTKSDSDQPAAARAAAAFAAYLLCQYVALVAMPGGVEEAGIREEHGGAADPSIHLRAMNFMNAIESDEDLVSSRPDDVEAYAREELESQPEDLQDAVLALLAERTDQDEPDTQLTERRRLIGRAFARARCIQVDGGAEGLDWDDLLRRFAGAALLVAQVEVWPHLSERERRRALSGLLGTDSAPRVPSHLGWRYLITLLRHQVLTAKEEARLREAMLRTTYGDLVAVGVQPRELMFRVRKNLAGKFNEQNTAARFLISAGNPHLDDNGGSLSERREVVVLLLLAHEQGAHGAKEVTTRARMSEWPIELLVTALWTALTRNQQRLDIPLRTLPEVLRALAMAGRLEPVLNQLLHDRWALKLAPMRIQDAREEGDYLMRFAEDLPASPRVTWQQFLFLLLEQVPTRA